jgi:hypothetical protein
MPATDSQILTVPEHSVVLAEEFDKSDQKVEELFEELKAKTGVFFDLVLEVYNANHEFLKPFWGR